MRVYFQDVFSFHVFVWVARGYYISTGLAADLCFDMMRWEITFSLMLVFVCCSFTNQRACQMLFKCETAMSQWEMDGLPSRTALMIGMNTIFIFKLWHSKWVKCIISKLWRIKKISPGKATPQFFGILQKKSYWKGWCDIKLMGRTNLPCRHLS